jgi:hypothetical protein
VLAASKCAVGVFGMKGPQGPETRKAGHHSARTR